jgi:hypothetical protein
MHSKLHEICLLSLEIEIVSQLKQYRASGNIRSQAFAQDIYFTGSSDLKLPSDDGDTSPNKHCPDGSFWHLQTQWPGVVIEIAYSQSSKKLHRLAWNYISGSDGGIQVVVGLELSYNTKAASLSVWRPIITTGEDGIKDFDCVKTVHQARIHSPPHSITVIDISSNRNSLIQMAMSAPTTSKASVFSYATLLPPTLSCPSLMRSSSPSSYHTVPWVG